MLTLLHEEATVESETYKLCSVHIMLTEL